MCEDVVFGAVVSSVTVGFMIGVMVQEAFSRRGRKK
jgi:hypothetical protein